MSSPIDHTHERFGRLVVQRRADNNTPAGQVQWHCLCDCGNETIVPGASLRKGHTESCGCKGREGRKSATARAKMSESRRGNQNRLAHGHARPPTPTYLSWTAMKGRCRNPANPAWRNYGGRGIGVCDRWLDFANFLADMGVRPDGHSLERADNDGNYEPGNCRWATASEQRANQRPQKMVPYHPSSSASA